MGAFEMYEIALDTLFCFDILLSFVTGFWHHGVYEKRLQRVAVNYVKVCKTMPTIGEATGSQVNVPSRSVMAATRRLERKMQRLV